MLGRDKGCLDGINEGADDGWVLGCSVCDDDGPKDGMVVAVFVALLLVLLVVVVVATNDDKVDADNGADATRMKMRINLLLKPSFFPQQNTKSFETFATKSMPSW